MGSPGFVGEVRHVNPPLASFSVAFDNGETDEALYARDMRPAPSDHTPLAYYAIGARVLASRISEGGWFEASVSVKDDDSLSVTYDDGDVEDEILAHECVLIFNRYSLGQEVVGLLHGEWLPGIICDVKLPPPSSPGAADDASCRWERQVGATDEGSDEPIRYSVLYEHVPDMVESGVLPDALRARVPGDTKATYTLDKRVMGRPHGDVRWLYGTVKATHPPGARSYCISFDGIGSQATVMPQAMRPFGESHFGLHCSA